MDSIRSTTTIRAGDLRVGTATRAALTAPAAAAPAPAVTDQPATTANSMAAAAPLDATRVQLIKSAIANGTFPLSPATIADRLIALKYEWMANDQA